MNKPLESSDAKRLHVRIVAANAEIAIARLVALVVVDQVVRALTLVLVHNRLPIRIALKVRNLLLLIRLLPLLKLLNIYGTDRLNERQGIFIFRLAAIF